MVDLRPPPLEHRAEAALVQPRRLGASPGAPQDAVKEMALLQQDGVQRRAVHAAQRRVQAEVVSQARRPRFLQHGQVM